MNKINKKTLFSFLLLGILFLPFIALGALTTVSGSPLLNNLATKLKNAAIGVGMIIAVIGFVIAAILWLTSGGSPEKTGLAKKALVAAIIGTVVLVIAGAANNFVLIIKEILGIP